jgi:hypothetical protein
LFNGQLSFHIFSISNDSFRDVNGELNLFYDAGSMPAPVLTSPAIGTNKPSTEPTALPEAAHLPPKSHPL